MTCTAFYNIESHYAKQEEEIFELPFRQIKNLLYTKEISFSCSDDERVFIMGNNTPNPSGTLALLPYCSRGSNCPIRLDDEKKTAITPTTTDGCLYCDTPCHIGKLFKIKPEKIAEIKVIGSSHGIDEVIADFAKVHHNPTHIIAVCCTPNLAKYLLKRESYPNVTVIHTPVIVGNEICLSSIDPNFNDRAMGRLPCTSFDSDALIKYLKS